MKTLLRLFMCCCAALLLGSNANAQCSANLLAALDENNPTRSYQTFDASVWTNDWHCPASGQISIETSPPMSVVFGGPGGDPNWVDSFFDVFTRPHTTKPQIIPMVPPGVTFQIITNVTFDDPVYAPLTFVETVRNTATNRLEIIHPMACTSNVPGSLYPAESVCFQVCHRVYAIPLTVNPGDGEPIIEVTPGCMIPPCGPNPTPPGSLHDFRNEVYAVGSQWYLEFEYSNPNLEPVGYCVTYSGNLPLSGQVHTLGGWDNERQTMDVSVWTNHPDYHVSGTITVFSYPDGAQFEGGGGQHGGSEGITSFFDIGEPCFVFKPPVGAGTFTPGQQFQIIGYIQYNAPGPLYPPEWVVEDAAVTPEGGIQLVNPTCTGPVNVPPRLVPGIPACLTVCHNIYHIPIECTSSTPPMVTITSGCDATTPCNDPTPCWPGAWVDFRYEVFRVGGTWMLEFEYSNPGTQPVCYCVQVNCPPSTVPPAFLLGGVEANGQFMNISVWGSNPAMPLSGEIHLRSEPPGGQIDNNVQSFFDVYLEPFTWRPPVGPGIFLPGQVFQVAADVNFFGPGSDPFEGDVCYENVIVTPSGTLALWDPYTPCTGDIVPPSMIPGQSECFHVCHRVYDDIILYYNYGGGRPVINVTPGCNGMPQDQCITQACTPGGSSDYVATVYHDGVNWRLRFEYSNPYIEPVCYCVTYAGNVPWDCDTRELAALDEGHMHMDVSTKTMSYGGYDCPSNGDIYVYSNPPGAQIGPYSSHFLGTGSHWFTLPVPVGPGSFGPGEAFQFISYVDYTDPAYPDRWLIEDVVVTDNGLYLNINDVGGECYGSGIGDDVPGFMNLGDRYCFRVCHRVYHVPLGATDPAVPPIVTITPGCYGPPQDQCALHPECIPGGADDYRWVVWYAGDHWELEFEYSNPGREPVCYCVTVGGAPCNPVTDLVTYYEPFPEGDPWLLHLWWTAPQAGIYQIWYCTDPTVTGNPPEDGWQVDAVAFFDAGPQHWSRPMPEPGIDPTNGRRYALICRCQPPAK